MNVLKLSVASVFALIMVTQTIAKEKVLQNGLENYTGCDDAYISDQSYQNNGSSQTLMAKYEKCES